MNTGDCELKEYLAVLRLAKEVMPMRKSQGRSEAFLRGTKIA